MSKNSTGSVWRAQPTAGNTLTGAPGAALSTRAATVITTASLADHASEQGSQALASHAAALLTIGVSGACRVRLFATDAAQAADDARATTTLATPGTGVLADFHFTGVGSVTCSPVAFLVNTESPAQRRVWYTIQNLSGGAAAIVATLSLLALET